MAEATSKVFLYPPSGGLIPEYKPPGFFPLSRSPLGDSPRGDLKITGAHVSGCVLGVLTAAIILPTVQEGHVPRFYPSPYGSEANDVGFLREVAVLSE